MNNAVISTVGVILLCVAGGLAWFFFSATPREEVMQEEVRENVVREDAITIIAFGDSLTAGYGLSSSEAYPAQLEKMLEDAGYAVRLINAGVSGETTRGNLERAQFIRNQNPDIVLLGIGGNDALRGLPLSETEKNMRATIDTLQSGTDAPRVLLLQMQAPLNAGFAYKETFDALYEALATEKDLALVPFITGDIFLDSNNKLPDGIHYNAIGYQKVVELYIVPKLIEVLGQVGG